MSDRGLPLWGKRPYPLLEMDEASRLIAAEVRPGGIFEATLAEAAGRVLAADVTACEDYPAFDKALMDGFAVRAADCRTPGAELSVIGLAPAGRKTALHTVPGRAVRINTGAPLPSGADAVVKIEETVVSGDGGIVRITTGVSAGQNVEPRGSIRPCGAAVLTAPVRIAPSHLAAAVTAGLRTLKVYERPGVAIVITGNEVVPAGQSKGPGQIHDSNGPMLCALMSQFGASPTPPTIALDTLDDLKDRFAKALEKPVVLACGGMSMGTLDLVPDALVELGVRWLMHGVSIRPGRPVAYGRGADGQHVFGLPGNPISVFVCGWLFVRPVVDGLQGLPPIPPQRVPATLVGEIKAHRDPRPAFVPARTWIDASCGLMAEPCRWRGSADVYGAAEGTALLYVPRPREPIAAGSGVDVIVTSGT
ncbi:MAG: molybdopterin molybdotransferase MoeA [Planctomycetota bacterium]